MVRRVDLRRPGFPDGLTITFADTFLDTSRAAIGAPAIPAKFKVETLNSGMQLDFRFRDTNGDRTLSAPGEYIEVLTLEAEGSTRLRPLWRIDVANTFDNPGASPPI